MTHAARQKTPAQDLCEDLEHYETPRWAVDAILEREILTERVLDPCAGTGVLCEVLHRYGGYAVDAMDIHDWGYALDRVQDWLEPDPLPPHLKNHEFSILMNPPFSRAVEFVQHALHLRARKIVCFQRMAWWESRGRRDFWQATPPNRVYVCGDRATSWRHDIQPQDRLDKKGKPRTAPTAHAWFIWDRGHPPGTLLGHIWKGDE